MSPTAILAFVAAGFSLGLALLGAFRKKRSLATWCFAVGMLVFALENLFGATWREADVAETAAFWGSVTLVMKSLFPGIWICFSLVYSRGKARPVALPSRLLILAAFVVPVGIALIFKNQLLPVSPYVDSDADWWIRSHAAARMLNAFLLISAVIVLMNLERTFRSAVGTMQWRIKFIVIGLGIVFGARVYTTSQALLFSEGILVLSGVDSAALLIGCALMVVAFLRSGFGEIDVYPSHAVLRTSVTFVLAGGYLVVVGVLAQVVASTGKAEAFELEALIVLLAFAALAIVLLSNRFRQNIRSLVSRHFKRPQYDFRQIWTRVTHSMSSAFGQAAMCSAAAKLISETFNVLSVSIWLLDEDRLLFGASTSRSASEASAVLQDPQQTFASIRMLKKPFDLEKAKGIHVEALKQISLNQFRTGGNRICVPLCAGNNCMGIAILADRVGATPYSIEEFDLLKCIGDQVAVGLLNLRLTDEITSGKELEAFQAMSAFFVHDLKNAASTLSLTLKNLPLHFDDPTFRQDMLRGIGETTERINQLISRLTALRRLELNLVEVDLNSVVDDAVNGMNGALNVRVMRDLRLQPKVRLDRDQFGSVINNLLLNARDAVGSEGEVKIQTAADSEWAILSVADNGCGMTPEFVRSSLFRPFQTTKKKGLGIGMFQSKMIVEAHQGRIVVKSEPAVGTTFRIMLPLSPQTA